MLKTHRKKLKDSVTTTDYVSFTGNENKYFDKHRKIKAEGPNMDTHLIGIRQSTSGKIHFSAHNNLFQHQICPVQNA